MTHNSRIYERLLNNQVTKQNEAKSALEQAGPDPIRFPGNHFQRIPSFLLRVSFDSPSTLVRLSFGSRPSLLRS